MLSNEQIQQAADLLLQARRTHTPGPIFPESCRPIDVDSALAIQDRVIEGLGEKIGGYKCAATDSPVIIAPIFASSLPRVSPVKLHCAKALVEPEIAIELWRDLSPRETPYTDAEIRESIVAAHFVVEILDCRFADKPSASPLDLLADNYNNEALFIGARIPLELIDGPLEVLPVKIASPTQVFYEKDGKHPSGHPLKAFNHLVRFLNQRGRGVKRGEIVTTGSYAGVVEVAFDAPIVVELSNFTPITLELKKA
jgi:2-keto-4-pentenoate hydratase